MQYLIVLAAVLALTSANPGYLGGLASNLLTPSGDTIEVAAAKANHLQAHANARAGLLGAGLAAYGVPGLLGSLGPARQVDPVAIAAGAPLPVGDTPEVAAAKAAHLQAHINAKAGLLGRKKRSPGYLGARVVGLGVPVSTLGYSTVLGHGSPLVVAGHGYGTRVLLG